MNFPAWSKDSAATILLPLHDKQGPVLMALQLLQSHFGYIHEDSVALIAQEFNLSRADVHGVLTFYHDFRTTPAPENFIQICAAEACQSVGARELIASAEKRFGCSIDSQGSELEIKSAYCFGNCALGPAVMVNGKLIGRATLTGIEEALR